MAEQQRIVVGVDGSESSLAALRWALRQAKLTGASLDAVTAWAYPTGYGMGPVSDDYDFEGGAHKELADALRTVDADVPVRAVVMEGRAAEALVHQAQGADLLVVGSRGHGALAAPFLGSVSLFCVLHAHCPVLVLRDGHDQKADRRSQPH